MIQIKNDIGEHLLTGKKHINNLSHNVYYV